MNTIDVNGTERTYLQHVPAIAEAQPVGLIIALHWSNGSGAALQAASGFDALADDDGVIVVYPDGIDGTWNAGGCCRASTADDVGFLDRLITTLQLEREITAVGIYGQSAGGMMAYRYLWAGAHTPAAVAVRSGAVSPDPGNGFDPDATRPTPTSLLHWHGALDTTVPIHGSEGDPLVTGAAGAPFWPMAFTIAQLVNETGAELNRYFIDGNGATSTIWRGNGHTVRTRIFPNTGPGQSGDGFPATKHRFPWNFIKKRLR